MPDDYRFDDAPKHHNALSDRERAALFAESLTEITGIPCKVTIRAVSYGGYLGRGGPYRHPDRIAFSVALANDGGTRSDLIDSLQACPDQGLAEAIAAVLGKRCSESYSATIAEKSFATNTTKGDVARYTVLIARSSRPV